MSHLDPERLALIALGEPAEPGEQAHLEGCDQCAAERDELAAAVMVGRATVDMGGLEAPPERVWQGILRDIASADTGEDARPSGLATDAAAPAAQSVTDGAAPAPRDPSPPTRARARTSGARAGRSRMFFTLAASIAVLLVIVGIGFAVRPAPPVELAAATLEAFPQHPGASGTAVVVETDGTQRVRVSVDAADTSADGFREVWLITADASALVSLGMLEGSEGEFAIPDGIDIGEYVLVDVSLEPTDGDPTHSGDSIVRGELHSV